MEAHTDEHVSQEAAEMREAPPVAPGITKRRVLSVGELRTAMQEHLRSTGALRELKTQLRGMVLTELLRQPKTSRLLVHGATQSTPAPGEGRGWAEGHLSLSAGAAEAAPPALASASRSPNPTLQTWSCGLADALVENHLRRTRRAMSLSLFSTEAEVPTFTSTGAPTEEERYLLSLFHQTTRCSSPADAGEEEDFLTASPARSAKSVLQRVVEEVVTRQGLVGGDAGARHLHGCGTQTDAADSVDGATNPLNSLECRLAAVDAKYALTFSQLKRSGAAGDQPFFLRAEVERRLQQYRSDMHAQLRSEYEHKYNSFTRTKLHEVREEAEERYRVFTRNKTEELAEMERNVFVKLELERQRLKISSEAIQQQRMELEKQQRDMVKRIEEHEAAQQRMESELQQGKQQQRVLQLQCAKWEELCSRRLVELDGARSREERRVEDLRRLQAEHAAELRLKDEEIDRQRYRLRLMSREAVDPLLGKVGKEGANEADRASPPTTHGCREAASVNSTQLYGLLLRSEEMQLQQQQWQQQQQQQRFDAAWVATASAEVSAAAEPAHTATEVVTPQSPTRASTRGILPGDSQAQGIAVRSKASSPRDLQDVPLPSQAAVPLASEEVTATSSSSSNGAILDSTVQESTLRQDTAATVAPQPSKASSVNGRSTPTSPATSSSPSSASPSPASPVRTAPAAATVSADPPKSSAHDASSSPSTTTSTSRTRAAAASPSPPPADERDTTAEQLRETTQEEQNSRAEVQAEEVARRREVEWVEKSKRAEALAASQAAHPEADGREDDDSGEDGARARAPWERPPAAFLGAQLGGGLGAGNAMDFSESFSTDDEALFKKSDDSDSDF